MTIRITEQMSASLMNSSINKSLAGVYKTYQQITSGQKLTSISENPTDGAKIMNYNKQLSQLGDWSKNIKTAHDELSMSYDTLALVEENLQRINDLTIQASSSINSKDSLDAIRTEIKSRTEAIALLANTKYQDKYIFAGSNTSRAPYALDDMNVTYYGTPANGSWQRNIEISEGTTVTLNNNGEEIFGNSTKGMFKTLKDLNDELAKADPDFSKISASINPVQKSIKNVTNVQALISGRVKQLDATQTINDNLSLTLKESRSDVQDTDYLQAASDLMKYQTALQASLKVGTSIMQQASLLNYI